ncbi:MAG TPA: Rieske 2Fe-2S domain-containing protein [Candidatus Kapabacteria bacterium]|nr:Rieske 2Fe-2S domain-containing protein [Candidatus Kapabacteria bacterium]
MDKTRRDFMLTSFYAAAAVVGAGTLASFLESCGSNPIDPNAANLATVQGTIANGSIMVTVDSSSPLANVGSAAMVQYPGGVLLVAHTAQSTFTALSSICTHQQCQISNYDSSNKNFVCLCHGSQFTTSGAVAQGPAGSPLAQHSTSFANNQLTIKA